MTQILQCTVLPQNYLPDILQDSDCPLDRNGQQDTATGLLYLDSSSPRGIGEDSVDQGRTRNLCIR